jgi:hypothetical protein
MARLPDVEDVCASVSHQPPARASTSARLYSLLRAK